VGLPVPHRLRRRAAYWNPAVREASLWPFNPHEMRHTCVALLIDQGVHPLSIQRYIGHSDMRPTMNTYGTSVSQP
jgi:integrase